MELVEMAGMRTAADFLQSLLEAVSYCIHMVVTVYEQPKQSLQQIFDALSTTEYEPSRP